MIKDIKMKKNQQKVYHFFCFTLVKSDTKEDEEKNLLLQQMIHKGHHLQQREKILKNI